MSASHEPITRQLIELLEQDAELRGLLQQSIAEAQQAHPDPTTNPVESLDDYYDYVDRAVDLIPVDYLANPSLLTKQRVLQDICYFYFLIDQPLSELDGDGLFRNTLQYHPPFSAWLRDFADAWGAFLDTPASWNEQIYQAFYDDPSFGLQEDWYESPSNWQTFNQFFSRHLRTPEMRPVAAPQDPLVVASPADSVPQGVWAIDAASNISVQDGLTLKLATYYSVEDLLGADSPYKDAFAGGTLTHTFLNVNDYHRYHFAVGGSVLEREVIQKNVALEVSVDTSEGLYVPIDSTGWQFTQTRGTVVVETETLGLVALIPMGMAQVSSVNFEPDVTVGSVHEKGDPLGFFLFGGSDFVMLFQEGVSLEITVPKDGASAYRHVLTGQEYGVVELRDP